MDDVANELDGLAKGRDTLPLAAINDDLPEGKELRASPATILRMLGKADDAEVSLQDGDAAAALNPAHALYEALAVQPLAADHPEIRALSIAHIAAEGILPLDHGVNPAWACALQRLLGEVVAPLIGERKNLSETDWAALKTRFVPYRAWLARRPETPAAHLGIEPLQHLLASPVKA